jgi:hypothetical protein
MAFKSAAAQAKQAVSRQTFPSRLKPEEQELVRKREEQSLLEAELTDRELCAANLRAELAAFERRYLHLVGLRYAELDRWKAKVAERTAEEQPYNERAQQAARDAWAAAQETEAVAGGRHPSEPRAFQSSPQMKRLYREVARRIHPDLGTDSADWAKRQRLMAEANLAHERGDEVALEKILVAYESSPETVNGKGAAAELVRTIRRISQIRERMAEIEAEIQELLRSELWLLKARVDEAADRGCDLFREMIATVEDQIAAAKQRAQGSAPFNR